MNCLDYRCEDKEGDLRGLFVYNGGTFRSELLWVQGSSIDEGHYRVNMDGNFGRERVGRFFRVVEEFIDRDAPVVFDVSGVKDFDSSGLAAFASVAGYKNDKTVYLLSPSDRIRNIISTSSCRNRDQFKRHFRIISDVADIEQ